MVARQLKIVSQSDGFTISVARNIQFLLRKLACYKVFVKDILDIYLNIIFITLSSLMFRRTLIVCVAYYRTSDMLKFDKF